MDYIDTKYIPKGDEVICIYYIEPNGVSIEEACEHIAAESSIGTWTELSTMKPEIAEKLKPHIFEIDRDSRIIKIAYPLDLFEVGNMPEIISSIAGNIYGMKIIKNLRLLDFRFPEPMIKSFKGPKYGINGVRNLLRIEHRPLLGTIIKPKVGLSYKEHANVAYRSWMGGCDIVKDDENLTNQRFNQFDNRIIETLDIRDRAEEETGEKKVYIPNITAETKEMIKRAEFVEEHGGRYIMIDIVTIGFAAMQTIRDLNLKLVIHAHRAMHAAITRNKKHGISMLTLAKISRIIGVDQIHIGTGVGKMEGEKEEVIEIQRGITEDMYDINPVFPVCSGGLHPALVPELISMLGENIIIQSGGGVHGHPDGTESGARAMRQAIDAVMNNIPLNEYASEHTELRRALEKWSG